MEEKDSVRIGDEVTVSIFGPDGSLLYKTTKKGCHSIENVVEEAVSQSNIEISPEDCVFEVDNLTTGVSHRYRLNAHGHIKLII